LIFKKSTIMKTSKRFVLWLSVLGAGSASAAPLSEGELTRVINDVKVLPVEASPFPAKPGARISGRTAVSTGAQSRAELRFSDNTLTRVGANSVFRMDQTTRTVDLQKGVVLLQVPKQLGGATVRTAAVTAAVTGTTVMFEYTADGYIKIIVIEGEVDVSLNKDKSKFRTLKAGDMWITKADDKNSLPLPVQVDLARLQRTSKLLNTDEFPPLGNVKYVKGALKEQSDKKNNGELVDTVFQIEGRGRNVTLLAGDRQHVSTVPLPTQPNPPNPPDPPNPPPPLPPQPPQPPPNKATNIAGTTVFDNQSTIKTGSPSNGYNSTTGGFGPLPGTIYVPGTDEPFGKYTFDDPQSFPELDQVLADSASWLVVKGDEIYIAGNPAVDPTNGPRSLILAATGDVNFNSSPPFSAANLSTGNLWTLDDNSQSLVFATLSGAINFGDFTLEGTNQNVGGLADGATADVTIIGIDLARINLPQGEFEAVAGQDIRITAATVTAKTVKLTAGRNIEVGGNNRNATITASQSIKLRAKQGVRIANSSQLRSLSQLGDGQVLVDALNGGVALVEGSTVEADKVTLASHGSDVSVMDSTISARIIKARVFDGGGVLLVSNAILGRGTNASDLIRLYGEGSQGVRFVGDTTLRGNRVDIAGTSVTIDSGSQVRLSNPNGTTVFADSHNYNNGTNGNFVQLGNQGSTGTAAPVNQQPYANRPKY
jgi:hypothetical protein